jgi:methylphosphotriester-DNA--protein-cysteine methyltransferase
VSAIKLFQQFQDQLDGKFTIGISTTGKFYFTPCGTYGRVAGSSEDCAIDELYKLIDKDAKQLEIERKVDELKAQIAELEKQLK